MSSRRLLKVGFIHPDLGLGGAERLVVDAALLLQTAGHQVSMFTAHHDRARCFDETCDGTLKIRVHGDFLPRHVAQHLRAPCAIVRMAYLASVMALGAGPFDVIFCDLVPHTIPLLKRLSRAKIVFYCHFPDQLLVPRRHRLYHWYRAPINRLEAVSTAMADQVLVNSRFTASVFRHTFPCLRSIPLEVLYPGVDGARYAPQGANVYLSDEHDAAQAHRKLTILSINRYERKKNLGLAIEALAVLRERLPVETFARLQLILAGGYDDRLRENRETFLELQGLVRRFHLEEQVTFRRSCTDTERLGFLAQCHCVVYTPAHEHFGLVPIEAMAAARPVVAANSGGPVETIQHEHTGLLCHPTPQAFAEALQRLITDPGVAARMGQTGRVHVAQHFSRAAFGARLEAIVEGVMQHGAD